MLLYTIFSASRKGGGYEPSSSTLGPRLCFTLTNINLRGLHSRRRAVPTPFPPRIKTLYKTTTVSTLSQTAYYAPMSFGPTACEGGHGTDQGRSRGREGDKVFALCSHIGRGFSSDPCGVSRELLLSSSPLFLQYLSDVRTEGVVGRSGMGAPAVVCSTACSLYSVYLRAVFYPGHKNYLSVRRIELLC